MIFLFEQITYSLDYLKNLAVLVPVAGGAAVVLAVFSFLAVRRAKRAGI